MSKYQKKMASEVLKKQWIFFFLHKMGDLYYINRSLTNINITTGLQYSNTNQHQLTKAN